VKNQVRVSITGASGISHHGNFVPNKNTLPKFPDFNSLPPVSQDGGGFYFPTTSSKPIENKTKTESTQNKTYLEDSTILPTTSAIPSNSISTVDVPLIESPAILPILLAVFSIFLIAGIIAIIIFRKQICRHFPIGRRFKKSKVDKAKKSNQSINVITMSNESSRNSMVMQHWQGPQSISNRYTPWTTAPNGDGYSSSSFSFTGGDIKVPGCDRWEFPRHRLKVFNILGEGAFGQVWRCEATDIDGVGDDIQFKEIF
jgi:fibroblast growth factor receptor 1